MPLSGCLIVAEAELKAVHACTQGCKGVYAAVHADLTQRLQQLSTAAKAGPLHVPPGVIIPQVSLHSRSDRCISILAGGSSR